MAISVGVTEKDPDGQVFYEIDWTDWNQGSTVVDIAWYIPMSMTISSESIINQQIARAKFAGGVHKNNSKVVCRMTNSIGEIEDAKLLVKIRD